jgi:hypothetical protein
MIFGAVAYRERSAEICFIQGLQYRNSYAEFIQHDILWPVVEIATNNYLIQRISIADRSVMRQQLPAKKEANKYEGP